MRNTNVVLSFLCEQKRMSVLSELKWQYTSVFYRFALNSRRMLVYSCEFIKIFETNVLKNEQIFFHER
jgi:hypothetical protein